MGKLFTNTDRERIARGLSSDKATAEEKDFLACMLSLCDAREAVSDDDYRQTSILCAINLHDTDSIFDR